MEQSLNEINDSLDSLVNSIKDSSVYIEYKHILNQVKNNDNIKALVKEIKILQKKLVNEKFLNKDILSIEKELKIKEELLLNIPLYQEYLNKSMELNELIQVVSKMMQNYLDNLGD
jgi:cell fate (sporulation/competence/biofilm development) regulator YmcA (YheA/YmcA/DUF963 family)